MDVNAGGFQTGKADMEKFRVIVWCNSCRDDEDGCFAGGYELIGSNFTTRRDAERAGAEYCGDHQYGFRVEQLEVELDELLVA